MYLSPTAFKFLLNIYPPYLGAGIRVEHIDKDWHNVRVSMKLRWYNRNAVGVHFGGSLYSMVDPHLMLMHMHLLGKNYIVWDVSASIEFIRKGTGRVTADFNVAEDDIENIIVATADGHIFRPTYEIEIKNEKGKVVARVIKELYIKRK